MVRRAKERRSRNKYEKVDQSDTGRRYPDTLASLCMVFEAGEEGEDSTNKKGPTMSQTIRQPIVDKLRASDLMVRECLSRDKQHMYVLVSASEKRQKAVAEIMGERGLLKLRLRQQDRDGKEQRNEGAWTPFKQHLQPLYEPSSEGSLFSSGQQLEILEFILNGDDERAMGPQLCLQPKPGNKPLDQLIEDQVIMQWFRMHNRGTRDFLVQRWALQWRTMQPIEAIREYCGEKITLYFVFLGYYTTMLWIPAMCGIVMTISQVFSHFTTGSMDNPWVPLYCCFICVWAVVFISGWRRVERTYQYEWDTLTFEDEEEDRSLFVKNKWTIEEVSDFTGTRRVPNEFWRSVALSISAVVVVCFIAAVITVVCAVALVKFRLTQQFEPYALAWLGGVLQALSIMSFNFVYQKVLVWLTDLENWQTDTQYEDATIAKDFSFKLVNAYFACFFVAFVQNNFQIFGVDMHCPSWHCMPELTGTLAAVFVVQMTVVQFLEVGLPMLKHKWKLAKGEADLRQKMSAAGLESDGVIEKMKPEEEEAALQQFEGVFSEYQEMIVQFGYVTLFAAAFPLTAALALINNMVEIRTDAYKLLQATQRPAPKRAADIGTWMVILDIIATCSILTNCALVGFTSHGLFFYFPEMTSVERVWITLICEHSLLLFKVVLDMILSSTPKEALAAYERRCYLRDQILAECQFLIPEDDAVFYTDDEGDPYYGV